MKLETTIRDGIFVPECSGIVQAFIDFDTFRMSKQSSNDKPGIFGIMVLIGTILSQLFTSIVEHDFYSIGKIFGENYRNILI